MNTTKTYLVAVAISTWSLTFSTAQQKPIDRTRVLYESAIADIETIDVEYSFAYSGNVMDESGNWIPSDEVPRIRKFCMEGQKFYWHEDGPDGHNLSASAWSGKRFFVYSPPELGLEPGRRDFQFRSSIPDEFYGNFHPANMTGIIMPESRGSLAALLTPKNNPRVQFDENSTRIEFNEVETTYGSTQLTVELSTEHDYMPSTFRFTSTKSKDFWSEWTVIGFLKTSNGKGKRKWFPKEIRINQSGQAPTIVMKTLEVKLNSDIPDEIFNPRAESGMVAADRDRNESYIVGSNDAVDKQVGKIINVANDLRTHTRNYRASWMFAAIAIVACAVAVFVWRRQVAR